MHARGLDKRPRMDSLRAPKRRAWDRLVRNADLSNEMCALGDRPMAGQRILAPLIKVRILVPQPARLRAHRTARKSLTLAPSSSG